MSDSEWDEIFRSANEGGYGPWSCPECDELTVEEGHSFREGRMYKLTLTCLYCSAERSIEV